MLLPCEAKECLEQDAQNAQVGLARIISGLAAYAEYTMFRGKNILQGQLMLVE